MLNRVSEIYTAMTMVSATDMPWCRFDRALASARCTRALLCCLGAFAYVSVSAVDEPFCV